jgi:uncharacterized protein YegL
MTKPNKTEIIFLVDRSGSMGCIAEAMTDGIAEFINKQKQVPGECLVSLYDFDDQYETKYVAQSLWTAPKYTLEPRGMTALYDAIGKTLGDVGERLRKTPEADRPSQVLFVIVSDGGENSSKEFQGEPGRRRIFDKITHQRSKYAWEFIFLGANQDAYAVGTSLGVHASNTVSYSADAAHSKGMMTSLSANVGAYRGSGKQTMESLFDQATYNAATGDNLGGNNPLGGVNPGAVELQDQVDAQILSDLKLAGLNVNAVPAVLPPGTVVTTTTAIYPPPPVTPPDSSQS